jgi:hypothetical protein
MIAALIYLLLVAEQKLADLALKRYKRKVSGAYIAAVEVNMAEHRRQFRG